MHQLSADIGQHLADLLVIPISRFQILHDQHWSFFYFSLLCMWAHRYRSGTHLEAL